MFFVITADFPAQIISDRAAGGILILSVLAGGSGLALVYGGYRLPATNIRRDLYSVVASWCLQAIGVMLVIVFLGLLAGSVDDPVSAFVVLPALASVAGLGIGYHDAHAKTRALDAEERHREAEEYSRELERYKTIVETVNDGIYITNGNNRFTLVNNAYCELVGYGREELIGSPSSLVLAEDIDVETLTEELQRDLEKGATASNMYAATLETASGETIDVEWTFSPLSEQDDTIPDTVGVVRDVTERNERERQLKRQNEQLDSFASLLAHELRNPVNIGQIYSQQLPREQSSEAVDYVTEAFDRIEDMIDVLLLISRGREAVSKCSPVELNDVIQEVGAEIDAPDATLEVATEKTINVDETYIRHLFRNLFDNAVEHGGNDVTITVGDLPDGFYVADDGDGISPDERDAIFETGYTTASDYGGMGLGLTFVKEMADVYDWGCQVTESEIGGAQFEFAGVSKAHQVAD